MTNLDGKISSASVKQASRRKNREYSKNSKNSPKYKELKKEVKIFLSANNDFKQTFSFKQIGAG